MRLSDIVSNLSSSTTFTQIALLLFLLIFLGACVVAFFVLRPESIRYMSHLPLQEDDPKGDPHV